MAYCAKCGAPLTSDAAFCPSCGALVQGASQGFSGSQASSPDSGLTELGSNPKAQEYWVKRLIAFVIDAIIFYIAVWVIALLIAIPAIITNILVPGSFSGTPFFGGLFSALTGILFVLYFTLAEYLYGKTIGKSVMGLRVKTDDGKKLTINDALIRNISKIYWVLLLLDVILGLALEKGYSKKYTDKYADTTVTLA